MRLADYFGITADETFCQYLVLDYAITTGKKQYYLCPARAADKPGRIADWSWTFADSPCIFLHDDKCSIEEVKPRGGRTYSCRFMRSDGRNSVVYGKRMAAKDWRECNLLDDLLLLSRGVSCRSS